MIISKRSLLKKEKKNEKENEAKSNKKKKKNIVAESMLVSLFKYRPYERPQMLLLILNGAQCQFQRDFPSRARQAAPFEKSPLRANEPIQGCE